MVRVSGSDVEIPTHGSIGPATVFLADETLVGALADPKVRERIQANLGGHDGFAWVDRAGDVTAIPHDEHGRVTRAVDLIGGLTIPAGSVVERADAHAAIRIAGEHPDLTIGLRAHDTGALTYSTTAEVDAWIRYFFARPGEGASGQDLDGFSFRLLPTAPIDLAVRLDPARPFEPSVSRVTPADEDRQISHFRTRWGAVVTLTGRPPHSDYVYAYDPVRKEAYQTLNGIWDVGIEGVENDEIEFLPGLAGAEYVRMPASFVARFVAGAPAFATVPFDTAAAAGLVGAPGGTFPLTSTAPGSEYPVETAWVYVEPAPADGPQGVTAGYCSQPARASLFLPGSEGIMGALGLEAAALPATATSPYAPAASFPAAPYAGLEVPPAVEASEWLASAGRFETQVLTPARSQAIDDLHSTGTHSTPALGPTGATAVTPQGLLSTFSPGYADWTSLVLAQADQGRQRLKYTAIEGKLRKALLSTELFLVVSDVSKLYQYCSTRYRITEETLALAKGKGVPEDAVTLARQLIDQTFDTAAEFTPALVKALTPTYATWASIISACAEVAQLAIAGWTFDLSSWRWATGDAPTMLVIKFADGDFESLVDDLSRWTLAADFNADPAKTQATLKGIVTDARQAQATEPDLQPFVDTVLATGANAWNGVLFLNVAAPVNAFPADLKALAAGLPATELRAHHLGVTLSSFEVYGQQIALSDSSLFGLILYQDDADLVFKGDAYDFKVLSLKVRFANSSVAAFSSQVELLVGRLFAELATLTEYGPHGPNNILLDGTLQQGAYRFAGKARYRFGVASQVVDFVTVERAQLVTLRDEPTADRVAAQFILDGEMGFKRLGEFDLFGFGASADGAADGGLAMSNMLVTMEFDPRDAKATRKLTFVAGQMVFDPARSSARPGSLPRKFPLQVAAMREGQPAVPEPGGAKSSRTAQAAPKALAWDGRPDVWPADGLTRPANGRALALGADPGKPATPADLGFMPVESPLKPGALGPTWFGLELTLSFGAPGGLAPKLGFTGALLASWAPSEDGYDVAIGLRLPGSQGGRKSMTIMGPLTLSIGRLTFLYDSATTGYLLLLQNMALSFLGMSFPPGGKTNATLFGNPDQDAAGSALGWYAAYRKDEEKKDKKKELSWPRP